MKPFYLLTVFCVFSLFVLAQSPQAFKYQLIARDLSGLVLSNQNLGLQISIIQDAAEGTTVYSERFTSTTDKTGLVNLEIGTGSPVSGIFSSINWGNHTHFLKLEIDPAGGTNYFTIGTTQLVSVPYALYAEKSGTPQAGSNIGEILIWNGTQWVATCPDGKTGCAGVCLSLNTDVNNCGNCGNICILSNAVSACSNGICYVASCNPGFGDCDGNSSNGCETFFSTDNNNCGSCGNVCSTVPNAINNGCVNGICSYVCNTGYSNCDGNWTNGCEVNLNISPSNCGTCGTICSFPHATSACSTGVCVIASCDAGWKDCNGILADGCETNTNSNPTHCGTCGNFCSPVPNAISTGCVAGICTYVCNSGYSNCDGLWINGCEVNVNTNSANCGACGIVCNLPHATSVCSNGMCVIASCDAGWKNCNGIPNDGCETNTNTSVINCSNCGMACPNNAPNATAACENGVCGYVCNSGFFNCDGNWVNGCETGGNPYYRDADQDSWGDNNNIIFACTQPLGYVLSPGDCDDNNPSVNSGQLEDCFNGIDDDCNDLIDEGDYNCF